MEESDTDSSEMANIKFESRSSPVRVSVADFDLSDSSSDVARSKRGHVKRKTAIDSDEDLPKNESESSDEGDVVFKRKGARVARKQTLDISSESDGASSIKTRRITKGARPQSNRENVLLDSDGIDEDSLSHYYSSVDVAANYSGRNH